MTLAWLQYDCRRVLCAVPLVAALALAVAPGVADGATWVGAGKALSVLERPAHDATELATVPAEDQEGEPVSLPMMAERDVSGERWLQVRTGPVRGWVRASQVTEIEPRALPLTLRRRIAALLTRAGHSSGAVFADSSGRPLLTRNAAVPRILASNTKLFVTAAAAARFGTSVSRLLGQILRPSDNLLAQRLLTRLGRASATRGRAVVEQFVRERGANVTIADGSGLSRYNRADPAAVVDFLVGMRRERSYATWLEALPVTGRTGTLAGRLRGTAAERACQAKTGTLRDVSTLSGYCTTTSGRRIVFSMLMNDIAPWSGRMLQDRILASLVALG